MTCVGDALVAPRCPYSCSSRGRPDEVQVLSGYPQVGWWRKQKDSVAAGAMLLLLKVSFTTRVRSTALWRCAATVLAILDQDLEAWNPPKRLRSSPVVRRKPPRIVLQPQAEEESQEAASWNRSLVVGYEVQVIQTIQGRASA